MADLYEVLGVEPNASPGEIRRAYNSRVLITHPDHNRDNTYAEKWTQQLNAAYDVLKDPEKRAAYDLETALGRPPDATDLITILGRAMIATMRIIVEIIGAMFLR